VIAGYPEKPSPALAEGRGYNSSLLASPSGEIVHNYRKTFLYETDQKWAVAGEFFLPIHTCTGSLRPKRVKELIL